MDFIASTLSMTIVTIMINNQATHGCHGDVMTSYDVFTLCYGCACDFTRSTKGNKRQSKC